MIGENYECDGQMNISDVFGTQPVEDIKPGECKHEFLPLRTKRTKYHKCVKCGKRLKRGKA